MGTGKSTLAAKLSENFGIDLLSTDLVRQSMFGSSNVPAGYGEGHYQQDNAATFMTNCFAKRANVSRIESR
jgi:predicted kinase